MDVTAEIDRPARRWRVPAIAALLLAEVVILAILYQFFVTIECQATGSEGFCRFLRSLVARALVVFAAFAVLIWAKPAPFRDFLSVAARHGGGGAMALHVAGVALLLLPLALETEDGLNARFALAAGIGGIGALAAGIGGLFWIAPPRAWRDLLSQDYYAPVVILTVAALLPDIAETILPLWDWQTVTDLTFAGVYLFLLMFSDTTFADPAAYIIGVQEFAVHIARQCSGIEGVALVTAFVCLYAFIFRKDVRFPHFWIVVLPLAILTSWLLNIVRIGVLVLIGAHVSPDLAVDGFHSYAGWMFFTLLALGIVWAVQRTPWLHRDSARVTPAHPLREDRIAAYILPFVVFMVASVVSQAMFPHPELGYPLRAAAMLVAIWVFRGIYLALPWRLDLVAIVAGAVVGVLWVVLALGGSEEGSALTLSLAGLSLPVLVFWIAARLIGTVLLVPLVEELFFRGYVLARLDGGGEGMRLVAIAVSSALFGLLHGRFLEAGLAGVVFALVMLRTGRVTDAVIAHMVANLIVALAALVLGNYALI